MTQLPEQFKGDGIIFYTDGSAKAPNPGPNGWGVHGYIYLDEKPKKGTGNPKLIMTNVGYVNKLGDYAEAFPEITPLYMFDFLGSKTQYASNLEAEVNALAAALHFVNDKCDVKKISAFTDCEYVRLGINKYRINWEKNNWKKTNGDDVPNKLAWLNLLSIFDKLLDKGIDITISWIKGHSGIVGNEMTDVLAGTASTFSLLNKEINEYIISPIEKYFNFKVERHPFISHTAMLFVTNSLLHDKGVYYFTSNDIIDDFIGKKINNGSYSVVHTPQHELLLENAREQITNKAVHEHSLLLLRLPKVYSRIPSRFIEKYPEVCFVKGRKNNTSYNFTDGSEVAVELNPPLLAFRALEIIENIEDILNLLKPSLDTITTQEPLIVSDQEAVPTYYHVRDINSYFFDTEKIILKKKEVEKRSVKKHILSTEKTIDIDLMLENQKVTVCLNFGIDLISRNSLKKIEETNSTIYLVYWEQSPKVYRYATIVKDNNDYAIYAGWYTNFIYLK